MDQVTPSNITRLDGTQTGNLWRKIYSYECGYYTQWIAECKKNREFYYGEQSTAEEKATMAARGQYEIVINKIRKSMRGIVGMVAAAVPQYKLVPLTDNDYYTASVGERIIKWAWANSRGVNIMRLFVKNAAVDNISYFHVYIDNMKLIKFKTLAFNEVLPDPSCTDPLFRDAEMIMIRRDVSKEYVKDYYGLAEEMVDSIQFQSAEPNNPGGVDVASTGETGTNAATSISFSQFLERIFSSDRQFVRIYEIFRKRFERRPDGTVSTRIVKETVLGLSHVFTEELDPRITEYPIIPGYVDKAENPYARGEVHFIKELQRFINKSFGVALLNAQLLSNPKGFITETDIPNNDVAALEESFATPGRLTVLAAGALPPTIVQGQPLNQAFFTMYQDAKLEMEWNTLPNQMLGMMDSEKNGFAPSAILDMKQTVLDSFKDFMSNIELSCTQLGLVVLQFARAYLPEDKIIRIIGEDDMLVNQKVEVDVDNEAQVQEYINYMRQRGVEDEQIQQALADAKEVSEKKKALMYFKNEVDFDKYDVTVIPGSYTPTYEMALLRLMMELLPTGAVDASVVLKYMPVDNREELIGRFDKIQIMTNQLERLEQEKADLESIIKSQNRKLIGAEVEVASSMGKVKIEKDVAMQRIKNYFEKQKGKQMTSEARNKMLHELNSILSDVEFEAERQKLRIKSGVQDEPDYEGIFTEAFGPSENT